MKTPMIKIATVLFVLTIANGCNQKGYYEPVTKDTKASSSQTQSEPSAKIKAPGFELVDLDGKTLTLNDYSGKVVFLDFWATWCAPCVISIPEVVRLKEEYKNKNVEVISISVDRNENMVRPFVERMKIGKPVAMAGNSQVDVQYRVGSIPSFFLIDQNGFVVSAWQGYHPSMAQIWRKELDQLLKA